MTDRNKRIVAELIQFQTSAYGSKILANYIFENENSDNQFNDFQNKIFTIVDKINSNELKFTAQEIIFIGNVRTLIIQKYKQEALMLELIRGDNKLSEMYDKKIIEVYDIFSDLKEIES